MKKGFTLIEMLLVIGIIALLVGASIGGYSAITKAAERTRAQELVLNVATALSLMYQQNGMWPKKIAAVGESGGKLDADRAVLMQSYFSLNVSEDDEGNEKLVGLDRFGIVSPWATAVLKKSGKSASLSTVVSSGKDGTHTIEDHLLWFAVDGDGDGIIKGANVGGESVNVRATAIVWCAGKDGKMESYTKGLKADDVYSWPVGQTRGIQ